MNCIELCHIIIELADKKATEGQLLWTEFWDKTIRCN